jgi:hypothetical protein
MSEITLSKMRSKTAVSKTIKMIKKIVVDHIAKTTYVFFLSNGYSRNWRESRELLAQI